MLCHLSIRHFAVVKSLDVDFNQGLIAVTGETGAGKSIAIDALGLCLGDRADASMVRPGADKAEIAATFCLDKNPRAQKWLAQHELDVDENECIIRRSISAEGRSKAFINGAPVPLALLRELGERLISIHGQHAHHLLLKPDVQRQTLDTFGQLQAMRDQVGDAYQHWHKLQQQFKQLQASNEQRQARQQLLTYQVQELDEFALQEFEFEELEAEFKRLSNSQALLEQSQRCVYELYAADEGNALSLIQASIHRLEELQDSDPVLKPIAEMLNDACIVVNEAANELRDYYERLEIDPMRIQQIEERYAQAMSLARKHQVQPEGLYAYHQALTVEFKALQTEQDSLDDMHNLLEMARSHYVQAAQKLSLARNKSAKQLSKAIEQRIQQMNMAKARVEIEVNYSEQHPLSAHGLDIIRLKVSTNPGLPLDTLDKVVSGGELSRIGLAIQVINAGHQDVPTLIFDEVDTGISGPTAAMVGQLLRELGQHNQVMCVTHLPQVAACAHHQMFVSKLSGKQSTETRIQNLGDEERIRELARLLAGDTVTESALANARELLGQHKAA